MKEENNKKHPPKINDECLVNQSPSQLARQITDKFLIGKNYDFISSFVDHLSHIATYHCKIPNVNEE